MTTDFEIEVQPRDETDKEVVYNLYFNKEKIAVRADLKLILDKIRALVEAIHTEPEVKKEKKS